MAIEKEYGKYTPICDGCLDTLDGCDSFEDAVQLCKDNGWQNVKVNGGWQNRCPNCRVQKPKQNKSFGLDW